MRAAQGTGGGAGSVFSRHEFGDKIYAPQHVQEKKSAPAEESAQCDGMQCMLLN